MEQLRADRGIPAPVQVQETAAASAAAPVVAPQTAPTGPSPEQAAMAAAAAQQAAANKALAEAKKLRAEAETRARDLELAVDDPAEWFAKAGVPQEKFLEFFKQGGELTPEQKRFKDLEKSQKALQDQLKSMETQRTKAEKAAVVAQQVAQAAEVLPQFPLAAQLDNAASLVRERALQISRAEGNRHVTFAEAGAALEADTERNLSRWLQNEQARAKLKVGSVNQPTTVPAATGPTTLGRQTAPQGSSVQSPRPAGLADRANRKAAFLASLKS